MAAVFAPGVHESGPELGGPRSLEPKLLHHTSSNFQSQLTHAWSMIFEGGFAVEMGVSSSASVRYSHFVASPAISVAAACGGDGYSDRRRMRAATRAPYAALRPARVVPITNL